MPVPVVEDVNETVRGLEAVGIGDGVALVEHEAALPGLALVLRKPRAHVGALREALGGGAVFDQQDAARREPAQEEA